MELLLLYWSGEVCFFAGAILVRQNCGLLMSGWKWTCARERRVGRWAHSFYDFGHHSMDRRRPQKASSSAALKLKSPREYQKSTFSRQLRKKSVVMASADVAGR